MKNFARPVAAGLAALWLVALSPEAVSADAYDSAGSTVPASVVPVTPATPIAPVDLKAEARQLIDRGVASYAGWNGYDARIHREDRDKFGRLKIVEMFLRREKPGTIFLKYLTGPQATLQVLTAEGKFDGKLMTRPPGALFDFIPIVGLSPDDPRIKKEEAHSIQSIGIAYMIEDFKADWAEAEAAGQAKVLSIFDDEVGVYTKDAEPPVKTRRLEVQIDKPTRTYPKVVLHFRQSDGLPVQMDLYKAGSTAPDETYLYHSITPNPAKDAPAFLKQIDKRLLEYYKKI